MRYEIHHIEGYSYADHAASEMLAAVPRHYSTLTAAREAVRRARQQAPDFAKRMGLPRIRIRDKRTHRWTR